MPIAPGEHADMLRAVGRLLDAEFAERVELANEDDVLGLSWHRKGLGVDRRHYQDQNLEELRKVAKQSRGTFRGEPKDSLAELLRTIGQDLDREGASFTRIVQEPGVITVHLAAGAPQPERRYLITELAASSRLRRELRSASEPVEVDPGSKFEPSWQSRPSEERPRSESWGAQTETGPLSRRLNR
ncbi:MAG TPA: hypothetical protein VFC51_10555 [Chloroflexota bacterium]|nr:hypothetical protein [Chloroflexota bacterium]